MASRPRYFPYAGGRGSLDIGVKPLDLAEWIEPDAELARYVLNKEELLSRRPADVFRALPGSEAAQVEVLELLEEHLPRRFPELYRPTPAGIASAVGAEAAGGAPLARAGLLVQEDLCVLEESPDDGAYVLTAAFVCAPTHWRLADKIGRPLIAIHDPVPGYAATIGKSVNVMFAQMKVERPMWRANWTITSTTELFQPERSPGELERARAMTPAEAGDGLFVRIERQTLRRLPRTHAILFTIRVYIDPVNALAKHPAMAADLRSAIQGLAGDQQRYKELTIFGPPLLGYLERLARS